MTPIRRIATVAAAAVVLCSVHAAHAQPSSDAKKKEAEGYVRQAAERYANGDRHSAVALFEKAYATYASPVILYNLGKAYRGIGRNALAHRTLVRVLSEKDGIAAKHAAEAKRMMADIERVVGLIEVVTRAGATVEIDADEIGIAPLAFPVAVEAGVHLVVVKLGDVWAGKEQVAAGSGKTVRIEVGHEVSKPGDPPPFDKGVVVPPPDVVAANRTKLSGTDVAITQPPPEVSGASKPIYKKWWFWTAVGVAVAGTAAVVITTASGGEINDVNPSLGQFDWQNF